MNMGVNSGILVHNSDNTTGSQQWQQYIWFGNLFMLSSLFIIFTCREGYRRMCRDGKIDAPGDDGTSSSLLGSGGGSIFASFCEGGVGVTAEDGTAGSITLHDDEFS
jgi:hypothetical protein